MLAIGSFVSAQVCFFMNFALLYVIMVSGPFLYIPSSGVHEIADLTNKSTQANFALLQTMGAIGSVVGPFLSGACFYKYSPRYLFIVQSVNPYGYMAVVCWTQLQKPFHLE
ncbi:hypothetical protein CW304_27015 [Bacillus sp. UFRGS-B20]|nr:hypothetical protein CW304_27015 [Bacillus sp. UFRGS-B20]